MTVTRLEASDQDLVAAVRDGNDAAFDELYTRYRPQIGAYVRGMLHDDARAEDVTQEAFLSALRRIRETDGELAFRPWIYRIAQNAAIDSHRRSSRTVEVSMDAEAGLRRSDQGRLTGGALPESTLIAKERLDHLRGAFDELPDVQARVLVMRDVDGLSYREIGERLDMRRTAVEQTLVGARQRLESEYEQLSEGRRCVSIRAAIARLADGEGARGDEYRLARHAKRCSTCRRLAREAGVEPLAHTTLRQKLAALLPLPWGFSSGGGGAGALGGLASERAAALVAAVAIAGAGGAALEVSGDDGGAGKDRQGAESRAVGTDAPVQRGAGQPGGSASRDTSRARELRKAKRRKAERRGRRAGATAPGAAAPRLQDGADTGSAPSTAAPAQGPSSTGSGPTQAAPKVQLPSVRTPQLRLPQVGTPTPSEPVPPVQLPAPAPPVVGETVDGVRDTLNGALP
ncbi:MAG TPA: sigma-70 family RNA polymerase sigma factor [Thermoleophilaceae bacterium]|jgi:RNA polymerase sigma factor (sigma-70 family)|nr:sigma-70 family RNA polymerase sigma factor [Thermoleophilaceae bacterium]